jgi:hypothetical protein
MAYSGTQVLGCYCSIPQQHRSDQGIVLSAHLCDFYTVPSHQGQGLNSRLAKYHAEMARAEGVRFVTVLNSAATLRTSRSRGFVSIGHMQGYIIRTGGIPLRRILWKLTNQKRPSQAQIEKILGPYRMEPSEFRNSNAGNCGVWHDYTQRFFAYKCFTPNLHIKLNGATFWVQVSGSMLIGDVTFETEAGLRDAIAELQVLCRRLGQRVMVFQVAKDTPIDLALQAFHLPFESWPAEYLDLDPSGAPLNLDDLKMNYGDLDTF